MIAVTKLVEAERKINVTNSDSSASGRAAEPPDAHPSDAAQVSSSPPPKVDSEDIVEPENALQELGFDDLPPALQQAARRAGWSDLMPVQAKTIPYMLAGRDLMVQSRTGSGKTGAFLLPIFDRLDPDNAQCQALVLVPTRELARQVVTAAEVLSEGMGLRPTAVYGGVSYGPQLEAFELGAHLVVGTPGRILDHLLKRNLTLDRLEILVFDEADRMLSMGFYPDMKRLQQYLPGRPIRGAMFSATFPPHVRGLAAEFLEQPEFLSLSRDRIHVAETEHVFYDVPAMKKDRYLMRIIEIENPASAIIFCNTKANVRYLSLVLRRFGYDADELSSDLPQAAREKVLDRVREGTLRFLVATDVAARGIDIHELSHVIQYEVPKDRDDYVHRVGRTGRAGATGEAITLVSGLEKLHLQHIARSFNIDMQERTPPTDEDVQKIVAERVTTLLETRLRDRGALPTERMQRFIPLARALGETDDEVAIIAMLLDDTYQESLHGVPVPPSPEESWRTERSAPQPRQKRHRGRSGRHRGRRSR